MPPATLNPPDRARGAAEPPPPVEPPDDDGSGDPGDGRAWVTVATFWQPMDAQLARIKLESEEIPCVLLDENLVATDWLYANAVGGIKLKVPPRELDRAQRALQRAPAGNGDAAVDVLPYESAEDVQTIAMFPEAGEAQLAAAALDGQGVESHIRATAPMGDPADQFERFSLVVDANDVKQAIDFLRSTSARSKLIDLDDDDSGHDAGSGIASVKDVPDATRCPACGSSNARQRSATRRSAALAILFLGFPVPFLTRQWTCDECGHDWT
jgi:hypothetical protein